MKNEEFLEFLKNGKDSELAKYYRTIVSVTEYSTILNETRREMIKAELDYRNASKMVELTRHIKFLTIVLCFLTFVLIVLSWPQIIKIIDFLICKVYVK